MTKKPTRFSIIKMVGAVLMFLSLQSCGHIQEAPIRSGSQTTILTLTRTQNATEKCNERTWVASNLRIIACATFTPVVCEIVVTPDVSDEDLGHEVRHCFDGDWHKRLNEDYKNQ